MSDAKRIKELLRERVTDLAQYLFPNGKRAGPHWCVGDIAGVPGKSFKICIAGDKAGWWGDFADSQKHSRNLLDLWMLARNIDFKTALREAAEWCGHPLNGPNGSAIRTPASTLRLRSSSPGAPSEREDASEPPFDWQKCVNAFTKEHSEQLKKWRGYSIEFCHWLENGFVGLYDGCVAFPVHDHAGDVVAVHYRLKDGSWRYYPQGTKVSPLVIGELIAGDPVHVFESPWDCLAFMDISGERSGVIITRGASNGAPAASLISETSNVYVWTQNDQAGEKWQCDIRANTKAAVKRAQIPAPHKDLNDWIRADATVEDLLAVLSNSEPIPQAKKVTINSLNSRLLPFELLDDYPPPLGAAAFHGLPGEIIRRIEPHTEADPIALLFQLVTAFGNLIGHDQYIVADGAPHYLNLYGVLVGQSSKGRKGTSWNHIANLMERVDPEWRQNRISNGLSSGEGFIWAVRDPIEESKPIREKGRCTGEYETYIANHGEADRRLLVIESEFANVLKVMTREGNTLSPVIRLAWDCGDLKTMVRKLASEGHWSAYFNCRPYHTGRITPVADSNGVCKWFRESVLLAGGQAQ